MLTVVCGGSGSGKSEYAENIITAYKKNFPKNQLIYIATMMGNDEETKQKILSLQYIRDELDAMGIKY